MKTILAAVAAAAAIGLTACATAENNSTGPATTTPATTTPPTSTSAPAPTVTKTVTPPGQSQAPAATPAQASSPAPGSTTTVPSVTDPWAVVSAYYGDVESGNYSGAWALLSYGMVTGQSYQQFVNGYSCTGGQQLTELGESGDQVRFNLTATDNCTGAVQHFTGVDTVMDGRIVAAHVTQTG